MKNPKISVVMPVFNSERYLTEALSSILKQTYHNFELIIINDGSADKTSKILTKIKDKRVQIITNKKNLGVAKSLNIGLKKAQGELIARCDSDDINNLSRFKKQITFLERHKDYVLVGSNFEIINAAGEKIGETFLPKTDKELRKKMIIRNQILHPSVMYRRKEVLKLGGYREILNGAEDYDLWFRLMKMGKIYNLQGKLIKRRWHDEVVTRKYHFKVEIKALLVRLINIFSLI